MVRFAQERGEWKETDVLRLLTAYAHKTIEPVGVNQENVSLLGFVAPYLKRAHAAVSSLNLSELELATETSNKNQHQQHKRQAARPNVVDEADGVLIAQGYASVDNHLRSALH